MIEYEVEDARGTDIQVRVIEDRLLHVVFVESSVDLSARALMSKLLASAGLTLVGGNLIGSPRLPKRLVLSTG